MNGKIVLQAYLSISQVVIDSSCWPKKGEKIVHGETTVLIYSSSDYTIMSKAKINVLLDIGKATTYFGEMIILKIIYFCAAVHEFLFFF